MCLQCFRFGRYYDVAVTRGGFGMQIASEYFSIVIAPCRTFNRNGSRQGAFFG